MEGPKEFVTTNDQNLSEIFKSGFLKMEKLDHSTLHFKSQEFQELVAAAMNNFEDATRIVSLAGVFSSNETFEEIITEHIKYLLLPFYLGRLVNKSNKSREEVLNLSEIYYKDFLKRCEEYDIFSELFDKVNSFKNENNSDPNSNLVNEAIARNRKIRNFQIKKEIESDLETIKFDINNLSDFQDDDVKRECIKKYLKKSVMEATEEIEFIKAERPFLEMRKNISGHDSKAPATVTKAKSRFKPIIITRDIEQKTVFGLGYPSIPVMTVREFYEDRVAQGIFPNAEEAVKMNKLLDKHHQDLQTTDDDPEEVQKEVLMENDNEDYLMQQRQMDEYKDVVRRGDGNRHNRS